MKKTLRVAGISLAIFFTIAYAVTPALAVSLAECITNSQDANNIIRSAPCGIYGIVNSRQRNKFHWDDARYYRGIYGASSIRSAKSYRGAFRWR